MNIWKINTENNLKIISDTSNFKIFYMKDTSNVFTEIVDIRDFGDLLYTANISFNEVGNYIIKLVDQDNNDIRYNQVDVVSENEFEFMQTSVRYSSKFDGPDLVFNKGGL